MELILLEDVEHLGSKNDLVSVKSGYGRNYLIPKGLAMVANASRKKHALEIQKQQSAKREKMLADMNALAESLKTEVITIGAKAGSSGKLFGSVTSIQIADALKKQKNVDVDRRKITLQEEIKNLGTYKAKIQLHKEISSEITFEVVED